MTGLRTLKISCLTLGVAVMSALPISRAEANVSGFGSEYCSSWTLRSDATTAAAEKAELNESRITWAQGFMSGLNWGRDDLKASSRQNVIHSAQEAKTFIYGVYHYCMAHPNDRVVDAVESMWLHFAEVPYDPSAK